MQTSRFLPLLFCVLSLFLSACLGDSQEASLETQEKHYQRGQQLLKEDRCDEALIAFLKVVDKRADAPESHLEAGRIYLDHIEDPIAAIYHFRAFLATRPDSQQAPAVTQLIETAQKQFAQKLPGNPYEESFQRLDLLQHIETLKTENQKLKQRILALEQTPTPQVQTAPAPTQQTHPATLTAARPTNAPAPPTPSSYDSYTVAPGDTLSSISHKVYGSSAKWHLIFEANKDKLRNAHDLKIGQKLRIPRN